MLFETWDPDHPKFDEDFDIDNNGLEDIIGDEDMQNLNIND